MPQNSTTRRGPAIDGRTRDILTGAQIDGTHLRLTEYGPSARCRTVLPVRNTAGPHVAGLARADTYSSTHPVGDELVAA